MLFLDIEGALSPMIMPTTPRAVGLLELVPGTLFDSRITSWIAQLSACFDLVWATA